MFKKPFNKKIWFPSIFHEEGRILGYEGARYAARSYPKMRGLIAGIFKEPKLLLSGVKDV